MEDPYDAVASEVQSSLQATLALLASYRRIKSTATEGNEELTWARNEVYFIHSKQCDLANFAHITVARKFNSAWRWLGGLGGECQVNIQLLSPITLLKTNLIRTVEETGARMFGLEEEEVVRRRKYVRQVRHEISVRNIWIFSCNDEWRAFIWAQKMQAELFPQVSKIWL
jgi:syntaxin 6